ncbi:hypothetical protein SAMN05428988_3142 [Chitinophaga sp. YR573]|uniref:hypothetical protein n=1 Tax=Chitinophaga sp. YR573 TaxID=1881040 RepID=UPI0008C8F8CC|nr:hypothetical protein [Chitinophaga sp. YR573]SEW20866.1 hypothetical protein SAMN05428988_3142 [Chitinophaga sp. YR573]
MNSLNRSISLFFLFTTFQLSGCTFSYDPPTDDSKSEIPTDIFNDSLASDQNLTPLINTSINPFDISTEELSTKLLKAVGGIEVLKKTKTEYEEYHHTIDGHITSGRKWVVIDNRSRTVDLVDGSEHSDLVCQQAGMQIHKAPFAIVDIDLKDPGYKEFCLHGSFLYAYPERVSQFNERNITPLGMDHDYYIFDMRIQNKDLGYFWVDKDSMLVRKQLTTGIAADGKYFADIVSYQNFIKNKTGYTHPTLICVSRYDYKKSKLGMQQKYNYTIFNISFDRKMDNSLFSVSDDIKRYYTLNTGKVYPY